MANRTRALEICAVLFIGALICAADASGGGGGELLGWMSADAAAGSVCTGTIAECLAAGGGDEEFELDSEVHRRILVATRYISYGALSRNTVPCSRRGRSYYNCHPGAKANPYTRGCSAITRCRR